MPPPKVEKGKHTQITTLGKVTLSATPTATPPGAHQPRIGTKTGNGPRMMRPRTPIQKQPMPPMVAPKTRSLVVAGACHHERKRWDLRCKYSRITWHLTYSELPKCPLY